MLLYYIFNIITVFLALAFVLVHLVAALSAILNGKKSLGTGFILVGAIVGILALLLVMISHTLPICLWILGSSLICFGAVMNGVNNKKLNKSHHQICFFIYFFITIFIFFGLSIW